MTERRLAVLGQPVAHSKSPALHRAAYGVLGLDWDYSAVELAAAALPQFVDSLDMSWRGLSLTMPHKQVVLPLLDDVEELVEATGAANTLLIDDSGARRGFNTDVQGIVGALTEVGVASVHRALIVGSGATAASAIAAAAQLGADEILLAARSPEKIAQLRPLAERLGLTMAEARLGELSAVADDVQAVLSTLPPGAADELELPAALPVRAALLDVAYGAGDTALAARWTAAGGRVATGLHMLYHQAVEQVRIFVTGGRGPLAREAEVRSVMRASVGL